MSTSVSNPAELVRDRAVPPQSPNTLDRQQRSRSTIGRARTDHALQLRLVHPHRHTVVVEAHGALDLAAQDRFDELVRQRLNGIVSSVILDLSELTFVNTAGMSAVLAAAQRARIAGTRLVVIGNPVVDRLAALMQVTEQFASASTVSEALSGEKGQGTHTACAEED